MGYAKRDCDKCGNGFTPSKNREATTCGPCYLENRKAWMGAPPTMESIESDMVARLTAMGAAKVNKLYEPKRDCAVCARPFLTRLGETWCAACKKLAQTEENTAFEDFEAGGPLPKVQTHRLAPPLKQAIFDLETFSLDRGWGVLMVGSILVHGDGPEPKVYTFDLTESPKWPDVRSDDSDLAARIMKVLAPCHILYAHNGARYDLPWLNSLALKYKLPRLTNKLIDPVQVARQKYRIGSNSLGAVANYLSLSENKMPVPPEVWRTALFDNCAESWKILRDRCESDVRILNEVASAITLDVGLIDKYGSARG